MLHVDRGRVAGDVDLGDDVEEEGLLNLAPIYQGVHHLRDEGDLRQQFVHDLGESDVDGVIVDAGKLEGELDGLTELLQEAAHVRLDGVEALNLLLVIHEHIRVDLVNEDLVPDVTLNLISRLNHVEQLLAGSLVVSIVSIDHVDERAALLNVLHGVGLEHVVAREVIHTELNVTVVVHLLLLDVGGWQQKEGLVRRHLLEDNLGDAGLARLGHAH